MRTGTKMYVIRLAFFGNFPENKLSYYCIWLTLLHMVKPAVSYMKLFSLASNHFKVQLNREKKLVNYSLENASS